MNSNTSVRLSDKDIKKLKDIQEAYEINSFSEMIRVLIRQEHERIIFYKDLNLHENLSEKQIFAGHLYHNYTTKSNFKKA